MAGSRSRSRNGDLAVELVAVILAPALAGHKLPAAVLLIPAWMSRSLPAPIALGLPRGHLHGAATFPTGPIVTARRSLGYEAASEVLAERMQPPITASGGVRIAALLDCQRLTAGQALSDRSHFPANATVHPGRRSRSPRRSCDGPPPRRTAPSVTDQSRFPPSPEYCLRTNQPLRRAPDARAGAKDVISGLRPGRAREPPPPPARV